MKSSLARFSLLLLVTCSLLALSAAAGLIVFVSPVFAQIQTNETRNIQQESSQQATSQQGESSRWYFPSFREFKNKVDSGDQTEIFGERYTLAQVSWIINSLIYILTGDNEISRCVNEPNPIDCFKALTKNNTRPSGTLFDLAYLSDTLLTVRPTSGINYISYIGQNRSIIPEAKAQGFGFQTLSPVLKLWQIVRNISYSFLILGIIAIAFMIMFRVKINPQTVISIQSALPRIILALILVTFSYAIAGFIVDSLYLINGAVAIAMVKGGITRTDDIVSIFNQLNAPTLGFVGSYIAQVLIFALLPAGAYGALAGLASGAAVGALMGGVGAVPGAITGATVGFLTGLIVILLLILALIVIAIRIFWLLLRTFIIVLFLVIASPFFVFLGMINQQSGIFGGWLKYFIANVAVFPAVSLLTVFSHILFWGFMGQDDLLFVGLSGLGWLNPFTIHTTLTGGGTTTLPALGSFGPGGLFGVLLGLGTLFMTPGVANAIRNAILTGRFAYQSDIGASFGPARLASGLVATGAIGYTGERLTTAGGPFARWRKGVTEHIVKVAQGFTARGFRGGG